MSSRERSARDGLLVALVAALVLLANLGGPRLWDDDEPRNAGCAREMLARGDWITPTFNAELRAHKPVLVYWCMMAAYSAFGVHEFAARLPSALAALGTALLVWRMGRRLFGPSAGLWAGIAASTMFLLVVAGRWATPDSVLIFTVTLALWCYVRSVFAPPSERDHLPGAQFQARLLEADTWFPRAWLPAATIYSAMGLAVLAKGPIGLILPTAVIGMFLLLQRLPLQTAPAESSAATWSGWLRALTLACVRPFEPSHFLSTCWTMRPITAIVVAAAVAAPWYVGAHLATEGEFSRGFFLEHNLERATRPMEGHQAGPWFYPLALLIGAMPWTVLLGPLVLELRRQVRTSGGLPPGAVLAFCWLGVFVCAFSLASTKLANYITPCCPAAALLAGYIAARLAARLETTTDKAAARLTDRWSLGGFATLALAGAALVTAAVVVARVLLVGEYSLVAVGAAPLITGLVCCLLWRLELRTETLAVFAVGAAGLMLSLFAFGLGRVDRWQHADQLLAAAFARSKTPELASYRTLEPSWVFYAQQPILEQPRMGANRERIKLDQARRELAEFLTDRYEGYVITRRKHLAELQPLLPPTVEVLCEVPLFLKPGDQLVLLGRNNPELPSAERAASLERLRR